MRAAALRHGRDGNAAGTAAADRDATCMRQNLVANGGGFISDNCYRLLSAIGQPVLGLVGNSEFVLESGFLSATPSTDDKLFRSGFETSSEACKK